MSNKKIIEKKLYGYKKLDANDPWKNVIDSVLQKYQGTEKGELIKLRYFRRKSEVQICMELYISRRSYYSWIQDIINDLTIMAAYEHLIKP